MLQKFLSSVFDEEHEFSDIWELKLIKFDTNIDDNLKPYQRHLAVSSTVEDQKGNPGQKGNFFLTNLRLLWYSQKDKEVNLSIGLDTINNIFLKSQPVPGYNDLKHLLTVKAMSPSQTKYEFKFAGFTEKEEKIFKKVNDMFKKCLETKYLRNIDTNVKLVNGQFKPLDEEEFKTKYQHCVFSENFSQKQATVIITNIRLIIIHEKSAASTNYGIPWIMIQSFAKTQKDNKECLQIKIRGLLKGVQILLTCNHRSDFAKMHREIVSFSETYNKQPTLGTNLTLNSDLPQKSSINFSQISDLVQFEQTKVNIGRRKNAYSDNNQKGSIRDTFFNEELGIMMQKLPEGCTRADLWEILR